MSILDPALAQKFIDKTAKYLEYNINVMNDKGIIIASKDPSRVGNFHEVAYGMLNGTIDTGIVKENQKFLGTKPGVNLFVDYKNKHVGVICVTGNPDTVHVFAGLMKTFMEAMLEYELQSEGERRRRDKAEQLLYYILFEENPDITSANTMLGELGLVKDLTRVCIIIKTELNQDPKKIIKALTKVSGYSNQDIITIARNDDIVMFKSIDIKGATPFKEYRQIIGDYLENFLKDVNEHSNLSKVSCYVGSLQNNISKYRSSYSHCQQLSLQVKSKGGIYFFSDYIIDYFRNLVTIKEYDNIFNVYSSLFTQEEKKQIIDTVRILSANNYNVANSAKALYIHRNTLLFRLNKLKDTLNIDPISNATEREFLNELAHYFSKQQV